MKADLNAKVSLFNNYKDVKPKKITLADWLNLKDYADDVEKIRSTTSKEQRDELKAKLPAITPSGVFEKRKAEHLITHSGFIQFDIDSKENAHIKDFAALRDQISGIANISYVGLSASGKGLWGLVPIKYPEKHKAHFRALEKVFKKLRVTIDSAPSNVASLRGYSYDSDATIRKGAKPFEALAKSRRSARTRKTSAEIKADVENLINQIHDNPIDVSYGYDTWMKIGFALVHQFGEKGRDYFHDVSCYHLDYDEAKTDEKFDSFLRSDRSERPDQETIKIGTFFGILKERGLTVQTSSARANGANTDNQLNGYAGSGAKSGAAEDFSNP